jgi:hypothetical protein
MTIDGVQIQCAARPTHPGRRRRARASLSGVRPGSLATRACLPGGELVVPAVYHGLCLGVCGLLGAELDVEPTSANPHDVDYPLGRETGKGADSNSRQKRVAPALRPAGLALH